MAFIKDNSVVLPHGNIRNIIEQIANEVLIEDYEIFLKQEQFTGDNYCGEISRIRITPHVNNGKKALCLIVKKAPTGKVSRTAMPIHRVYVVEMFIYTDVIPAFYRLFDEFHIPSEDRFLSAQFFKGINEDLKEIIILKDLSDDEFVMCNKRIPFNYEQVSLVLQNLARVHACSFVMKEKNPEQFSKLCYVIPHKINFGDQMPSVLKNIAKNFIHRIQSSKNRMKTENFVEKMEKIFDELLDSSLSEPYNVICHGDSWNNNMLFKYDKNGKLDQLVLIDWQISRIASPLTDLVYMFCMSTSPTLLESQLDQLLDLYYETLRTCMKNMDCDVERSFPKKVFLEHFRRFMPYGLAMALGGLPIALSEPGTAKEWDDYDCVDGNTMCDVPVNDLVIERISGLVDFIVKNDLI